MRSLTQLAAEAVKSLDRPCTPDDVYEAIRDELPPGKTREHVQKALCHASDAGLIVRVSKGKAGGLGGSSGTGVFAPRQPARVRRVASVFDLALSA